MKYLHHTLILDQKAVCYRSNFVASHTKGMKYLRGASPGDDG